MTEESLLAYDEDSLLGSLGALDPRARALFAAACAERLSPAYERFRNRNRMDNGSVLRNALAILWAALEEGDGVALQSARRSIESLLPFEFTSSRDAKPVIEFGIMEDATTGTAYAIECAITGDAQAAALAARHVYVALDHFVSNSLDIDFNVAGSEVLVLGHPVVQAELRRQRRDLSEVQSIPPQELTVRAPALRQRAESEGAELLDHIDSADGGYEEPPH